MTEKLGRYRVETIHREYLYWAIRKSKLEKEGTLVHEGVMDNDIVD